MPSSTLFLDLAALLCPAGNHELCPKSQTRLVGSVSQELGQRSPSAVEASPFALRDETSLPPLQIWQAVEPIRLPVLEPHVKHMTELQGIRDASLRVVSRGCHYAVSQTPSKKEGGHHSPRRVVWRPVAQTVLFETQRRAVIRTLLGGDGTVKSVDHHYGATNPRPPISTRAAVDAGHDLAYPSSMIQAEVATPIMARKTVMVAVKDACGSPSRLANSLNSGPRRYRSAR